MRYPHGNQRENRLALTKIPTMIVLDTNVVSELMQESPHQIAAIARSREASIATRNVRDFEGIEVELIDPWSYL